METTERKRRAHDVLQVINGLVDVLKEYDIKHSDFCITGSYALQYLGLNLNRELNDVDLYLIVHRDPEKKYKEVLKRLICMQYVSGYSTPYDDRNTISLDFQGMKVNIFIVFDHLDFRAICTSGGYYVDTIDHTLSKKMALKRLKDYKDLNTIIQNLLSL